MNEPASVMLDLVRICGLVFTATITNNETTGESVRYDSDDVDSADIRRNLCLRNLEKKGKNGI